MRPTRPLSLAPRSGRAPYPPRWSASDGGVTGPHQPLQPRLKHMVCPEVSRLPGGTIAPDGLPLATSLRGDRHPGVVVTRYHVHPLEQVELRRRSRIKQLASSLARLELGGKLHNLFFLSEK